MKFAEEELNKFLKDEPFLKNNECFCLGNTMEEAGYIVKKLKAKENTYVEMAN